MSVYATSRRKKSLQECQLNWKIRFGAAYRAQLPIALGVGAVVAAVAVFVLQGSMGFPAAMALGACMLAAIPVVALGPVLAGLEPYPTAAQHAKSNMVIDMRDDLQRRNLGADASKPQISRG